MAGISKSSEPGKRSWQGAGSADIHPQSRFAWRWLLSALALLLVALAIYWVYWNWTGARTLLVVIDTDRQERGTIPPVPYLDGDRTALVEQWAQRSGIYVAQRKLHEIASWDNLLAELAAEPGAFQSVSKRSAAATPRDTVVLYFHAHGVVVDRGNGDQAQPRPLLIKSLSGSDLQGDWTTGRTLDVGELLEAIDAAYPKTKTLVVLDVVHFNYDPRLGVMGCAFAQQVERSFPKDAKNLWVLISSGDDELATVLPQQGRSSFNVCLLDALRRETNGSATVRIDALKDAIQRGLDGLPTEAGMDARQQVFLVPKDDSTRSASLELPRFAANEPPAAPVESPKPAPGAQGRRRRSSLEPPSATAFRTSRGSLIGWQQPLPADGEAAKASNGDAGAKSAAIKSEDPAPTGKDGKGAVESAATSESGADSKAKQQESTKSTLPSTAAQQAPSQPVSARDAFHALLLESWRLRDQIGALGESRNLASPAHYAPHRWRRLETQLVSFEERFLYGETLVNADRAALMGIRNDLVPLLAKLEGRAAGDVTHPELRELAADADRLRGQAPMATVAQLSYQSSVSNPLQEANAALRTYADIAYRLPDYVRLHGLLTAAGAGGESMSGTIGELLNDMKDFRGVVTRAAKEDLTADKVLDYLRPELAKISARRSAADAEVESLARSAASSLGPATPQNMLRIRLLLSSPLLAAPQRERLYEALLRTGKVPVEIPAASSGSRANSAAGLQANADLLRKMVAYYDSESPSTVSPSPFRRQLDEAFRQFASDSSLGTSSPSALGAALRRYFEQLPQQVQLPTASMASPTAFSLFERYHTLLLVDGRDAQRFSATKPTAILAQPIRKQEIPDEIAELQFAPAGTMELLASKAKEGQPVNLKIALQTEQVQDLPVQLRLVFPKDLIVRWENGEPIETGTTVVRHLQSKQSSLGLLISSVEREFFEESPPAKIAVSAQFRGATAAAELNCLLPKPQEVELILAADSGTGGIDANRSAKVGPARREGAFAAGMLKLFPNRTTAFRMGLRNLSSDRMEARVHLLAVPPSPDRASGRVFGPEGRLPAGMDAFVQMLMRDPLDFGRFRKYVVAQSDEKTPLILEPGATAPVALALASDPPGIDGGLVCVVTSIAPGPAKQFLRWLELDPFDPGELYQVDGFSYRSGRLEFDVSLKDPSHAPALGLLEKPISVRWDRTGDRVSSQGESKIEGDIADGAKPLQLFASIPPDRTDYVLQLRIDDYPRAAIHRVRIDSKGTLIGQPDNLKRDTLDGVHIAGATLQVDSKDRKRYVVQAAESAMPRSLTRVPQDNAAASSPPGAPPAPELRPVTISRGGKAMAAFPVLRDDARFQLLVDVQADVRPSFFAAGGRVEVELRGQSAQRFFRDREVKFSLPAIEGSTLKFGTRVSDFERLPFPPRIEVADDKVTDLSTDLTARLDAESADASRSEFAIHRLPMVFDGNPPHVKVSSLRPAIVRLLTQKVMLEVETDDGDGSGVEQVRLLLAPAAGDDKESPKGVEPKNLNSETIDAGRRYALSFSLPEGLKNGAYRLDIQAIDAAGHVGVAEGKLPVNVVGPIPDKPTLPKVKGKKDEPAKGATSPNQP